jgi:hypothetical protein
MTGDEGVLPIDDWSRLLDGRVAVVTDDDDLARLADAVLTEHGRVDVLSNNVGDYRAFVRCYPKDPVYGIGTGHNIPVDGGTKDGGGWPFSPREGRFVNRSRNL